MFSSGDAGEADRLRPGRAFRGHILEFSGMSGTGEQHSADGKVERETVQAAPAVQTATSIDYVVKESHVPPYPP
ncbi:hypothetical protein BDHH15_66930 [Bradyrhizobium diazoefficiens]|uniref:Uncharacterized protein n=1 Tax=Bradyrhizobium diazoefficiens TaxID=1355477 RepID=A0A810C1X8_9BRAD|nr:hypothetical protein H12S4_70300 [Bradyrhizobium diazoefficiens]BCA23478.1 hypothetical protein BDHH15_66930 [Bradyrhizobium diazoefficiens]BCE82507.1 hypothetical protein XF9B_39280 [Bradyrhizobium diazoefficiens]BCF02596.1 hypothetical protein XF11B_66160 [Bradyrhizobium diazoefficiens]BCF08585.1 hypothetical protein XF12B_39580 [Bradyrhizobium diazoefficiens]